MDKKCVRICDDSREFAQDLKAKLARVEGLLEAFKIDILREDFPSAAEALEARLRAAARGEIAHYPDDAARVFDETDILVVDYNLLDFGPSFTGERLAYLARCYSRCGLIVGLNQFEPYVREHFDLTLRGHSESYADVSISSDSLSNPGLWREPWHGFRPWYWPLLPLASDALQRRVEELEGHLHERILAFLGFEDSLSVTFPRGTVAFVSRTGDLVGTTFSDFVRRSGNGLRGRGTEPINDEAIVRIAAARIGTWLTRMVLPAQDILVDAPHVISRYQSLLLSEERDAKAFDRTASLSPSVESSLSPILGREEFRYRKLAWLDRPAWFWDRVSNCEEIREVSDPWSVDRNDLVFAEDVSRFIPEEESSSFVADLESSFVRRFVKRNLPDVAYVPEVRFSL